MNQPSFFLPLSVPNRNFQYIIFLFSILFQLPILPKFGYLELHRSIQVGNEPTRNCSLQKKEKNKQVNKKEEYEGKEEEEKRKRNVQGVARCRRTDNEALFGSRILNHEKGTKRNLKHFLYLGYQRKKNIFLKERKIGENSSSALPVNYFPSCFFFHLLHNILTIFQRCQTLKKKVKGNLNFLCLWKEKKLISFSFLFVNQTKPK